MTYTEREETTAAQGAARQSWRQKSARDLLKEVIESSPVTGVQKPGRGTERRSTELLKKFIRARAMMMTICWRAWNMLLTMP